MWRIVKIINLTSPQQQVLQSGGGEVLNEVRGPEGASYRIVITEKGFLDLVDVGKSSSSSWGIYMNGSIFNYESEGRVTLTFLEDGSFQAADSNSGGIITGQLKPLPTIAFRDALALQEMMDLKLVPYQNIPDAPGKTDAEIEHLGQLFFPFTEHKKQLAFSVYDWTTASFMRIVMFRFFVYTGIEGGPLDLATIANVIWSSNWPPFTPQNKDYMHSFLMLPADSEAEVHQQLDQLHNRLQYFCNVQNRLLKACFYSFPRTSVYRVPHLYSGQPDISNLGLERFAAEFLEFPGNSGPVGTPMQMPFQYALQTVFKVSDTITTKGVMSFTEYREEAMEYSNGILLVLNPAPGAIVWERASYITALSDDPEKNEYTFSPGSKFLIQRVQQETVNSKEVWVFEMVVTI